MKEQLIIHDERTDSIENASYRWAYLFMSFGLLTIVAYRSFAWQESNWDLLALVVLSGFVTTVYQGMNHILSRQWVLVVTGITLLAAVVAAIIVFFGGGF